MSRNCVHHLKKVQQFKHAEHISRLSRGVSSSPVLLKDNDEADKKEKKDKEDTPEGFFSRFKQEFMKDLETDNKSKETFQEIQKQSAQLQAQYDKYIGSKLPKYLPKIPRKTSASEELEEETAPKISFRERADLFKARLQKERLQEDYENAIKIAKAKSESSYDKMRQWKEKRNEPKNLEESEEIVKPPKSTVVRDKFNDLFEKSGLADNPYYQKAKEQTTSVLNVS